MKMGKANQIQVLRTSSTQADVGQAITRLSLYDKEALLTICEDLTLSMWCLSTPKLKNVINYQTKVQSEIATESEGIKKNFKLSLLPTSHSVPVTFFEKCFCLTNSDDLQRNDYEQTAPTLDLASKSHAEFVKKRDSTQKEQTVNSSDGFTVGITCKNKNQAIAGFKILLKKQVTSGILDIPEYVSFLNRKVHLEVPA